MVDYNTIPIRDTLEKCYYCSQCLFIFTNVYQLDCGCRFCFDCTDKVIINGKCVECKQDIPQIKRIDKAFQKELNNIKVNCSVCEWNGKLIEYWKHYTEIHKILMCKYCKKTFNDELLLKYHLDKRINDKCEFDELKCMYNEIGCSVEGLNAENMQEHLHSHAPKHLDLVYYYYLSIKGNTTEQPVQTQSITASSSNSASAIVSDQSDLYKQNKRRRQDEENYERLRAYEQKSYLDDLQQIAKAQDSMEKEIYEHKIELENINNDVEELKSMMSFTDNNISTLKSRIDKHEMLSNVGSYVWKIRNVMELLKENKPIYSNSFYTHPYGYCARLCAYLNGDGRAHPEYLSLFFVIVKGDYDALLRWPFRLSITLEILDQSKNRKHFKDSFKPNPTSNSFSRPINEMNIPFGIQHFCPHATLFSKEFEYIKNNEMFIQVSIDINDVIEI